LGGANLALVGMVTPNHGQSQVGERPSTLDKDGPIVEPTTEVSTPSVVPPEVLESSHAPGEAYPLEDVSTF